MFAVTSRTSVLWAPEMKGRGQYYRMQGTASLFTCIKECLSPAPSQITDTTEHQGWAIISFQCLKLHCALYAALAIQVDWLHPFSLTNYTKITEGKQYAINLKEWEKRGKMQLNSDPPNFYKSRFGSKEVVGGFFVCLFLKKSISFRGLQNKQNSKTALRQHISFVWSNGPVCNRKF